MEPNKTRWRLLRRRSCLVPTWQGWLVLLLSLAGLTLLGLRGLYPFLAVTDSRPGGVLAVEGWTSDNTLAAAVAEFNRHHYDKVYVTGGPMDSGAPLSEYKTYAQFGAAVLRKLGLSSNVVQAVPAPPVRQDRTYACAVSLGRWWGEHGLAPAQVHLLTEGPHARRSRLMFEKALGKRVSVGVTAVPPHDYDERHWWRSSSGFRAVTGEALAYSYARFFFRAPCPKSGG
jgi:hypothetical protein